MPQFAAVILVLITWNHSDSSFDTQVIRTKGIVACEKLERSFYSAVNVSNATEPPNTGIGADAHCLFINSGTKSI